MAKFEMFACFQDKMVLQRESDVKIWGFADDGTSLNMEFCGKEYTAAADNEGEFVFNIRTNEAGGPFFHENMLRRRHAYDKRYSYWRCVYNKRTV